MTSIEEELAKSYGAKNAENSKRTLSTGGKILIGLSGKWAINSCEKFHFNDIQFSIESVGLQEVRPLV